jgi:hypothetical protein
MALIIKTFSYDPDDNPKVHEWCKKMSKSNFSDNMRKLIESQTEKDVFAEIRKIQSMLDNLQPSTDQSVIEFLKPISIENTIEFNRDNLKNRLFK